MTHTPGPWKVKSRDATSHRVIGGGGTIATIITTSKHPPEVKLANARLIAAAPQLLEALQALEWLDIQRYTAVFCPRCFQTKKEGHVSDCQTKQALAAAKGGGE
jgi:hypothetical protein